MGLLDGLTAQPRTAKVGATEYKMAPLTVGDFGEYLAWAQDEYLKLVQRNLPGLPDDMRSAEWRAALRDAAGFSIGDCPRPPLGDQRLAWMSLRKAHPDVTFDAFLTLISNREARKAIFDAFGLGNRSESNDPKAPTAPQ